MACEIQQTNKYSNKLETPCFSVFTCHSVSSASIGLDVIRCHSVLVATQLAKTAKIKHTYWDARKVYDQTASWMSALVL